MARRSPSELLARWRNDVVLFALEVLGLLLWGMQAAILTAIAAYHSVAVKSGQKTGKSTAAVIVALWFAICFPRARVIFTAPSGHQIKDVLWKELRRVYDDARKRRTLSDGTVHRGVPLGGKLNQLPSNGLKFENGNEIIGVSAKDAEGMAGISAPNTFFIVDEASGVSQGIFDAIEGNRAADGRLLLLGNPTRTTGFFFDAFHSQRELWSTPYGKLLTISSEDNPNIVEGRTVIPGLAERPWLDRRRKAGGPNYRDNPLYRVRVLGEFPRASSDAIVGLDLIEVATLRWKEEAAKRRAPPTGDGRLHLGVDVARFGDDDSVIQPRRGWVAAPPIVEHGLDGEQLAGVVMKAVRDLRGDGEKPVVIIDANGVGASPADHLRKHRKEIDLVEIVSSESSDEPEKYTNLRTQLMFSVSDWLAEGGMFEEDPALEAELLAGQYAFDSRQRQRALDKDEIKKRIGRSPDKGDALALSLYEGTNTIHIPPPRAPRAGANRFAGLGRRGY